MNLFTEPPLGPDAHTVADDQHPDHQLRVNRGPSNLTVKGLQSLTETLKVEMPVNAAQQMIGRDMVVEAKVVKQLGRCRLNAHHRYPLPQITRGRKSQRDSDNNQSLTFSTISAHSRHPPHQLERQELPKREEVQVAN